MRHLFIALALLATPVVALDQALPALLHQSSLIVEHAQSDNLAGVKESCETLLTLYFNTVVEPYGGDDREEALLALGRGGIDALAAVTDLTLYCSLVINHDQD